MNNSSEVAIVGGTIYTPWQVIEGGTIQIEEEVIVAVGAEAAPPSTAVIDARGPHVVPGFVDIHVHGAMGHDTMDATPEAISEMARFFAEHGVTGFLATTMTGTHEATVAAVRNVARCQQERLDARILGVHLEGPYINRKFPGAQSPTHIRPADPDEYEQLFAHGNIRLITLAPEIEANQELVRYAAARGAALAAGHSAASYDDVLAAMRLGLNQATHTFNAMPALHHRQPGIAGATLAHDELFAQAIVDLIHLHPAVVKILIRCKGVSRTVLVTDAMRAAGLPDGEYELGGQPVTVHEGRCTLAGTETLAGSTLTMDQALRNLITAAGLSLREALPAATAVPAASIGLGDVAGVLAPGRHADIVLLNDALEVQMTVVGGRIVYRKE